MYSRMLQVEHAAYNQRAIHSPSTVTRTFCDESFENLESKNGGGNFILRGPL